MKVGSANYDGNFKKKTYKKIKDGEQAFRILPPLGSNADKGIWSVYWNVHYGYTNSQGHLRTFASPLVKNFKSGLIEIPDAALERIQNLKAQLEEAKKNGNAELATKLNALVGGKKPKFNMDSNHFVNAIDEQGNIVILQLRNTAMKLLKIEIAALRDKGIDPLAPETGRFFVFRRTGTGLDTSYKVSVQQRQIDVPGVGLVMQDVVHKMDLSPAGLDRLSAETANLKNLFKTPTSDEVARIVKEGATAVDAILDARGSSDGDEVTDDDSSDTAAPVASAPPVTSSFISTPAPASASTVVTTTTGNMAPPLTVTAVAPVAPATPTAPPVATMSDEDFLKSMGL